VAEDVPLKDVPLKTIKTILHELIEVQGEDVLKHLEAISNRQNSHVYNILLKMLEKSGKLTPTSKSSEEELSRSSEPVETPTSTTQPDAPKPQQIQLRLPSTQSFLLLFSFVSFGLTFLGFLLLFRVYFVCFVLAEPLDLRDALSDIFGKIGDKEGTKQGLRELYLLKRNHPESTQEIDMYLASTSSFFQGYIARGLATAEIELAEEEAAPATSLSRSAQGQAPAASSTAAVTTAGDAQEYKLKLERLRQMYTIKSELPDGVVLVDEPARTSSADDFVVTSSPPNLCLKRVDS